VGRWSRVGAGAVVIADVPDHCTAVGNPARIVPGRSGEPVPDPTLDGYEWNLRTQVAAG
jgi:serine acetyltransferase